MDVTLPTLSAASADNFLHSYTNSPYSKYVFAFVNDMPFTIA